MMILLLPTFDVLSEKKENYGTRFGIVIVGKITRLITFRRWRNELDGVSSVIGIATDGILFRSLKVFSERLLRSQSS